MKKKVQRVNLRDIYKKVCDLEQKGEYYRIGVKSNRSLIVLSEDEFVKIHREGKGKIKSIRFIMYTDKYNKQEFKSFDDFVNKIDNDYSSSIHNSDVARYTSSEDFIKFMLEEEQDFKRAVAKILKEYEISENSINSILECTKFDWNFKRVYLETLVVASTIKTVLEDFDDDGNKLDKVREKVYFVSKYRKYADIRFRNTPLPLYESKDSYAIALASIKLSELVMYSYKRITSKIINGLK